MKKNRAKQVWMSVLMLIAILGSSLGGVTAFARVMNVEKSGSLTIHKYLNPDITPIENGGGGFEGDGTSGTKLPNGTTNTGNGETVPLPGTEFSVFGRLTEKELGQLLDSGTSYDPIDPKPLDTLKVKQFMDGKTADYKGVTNEQGQVTFGDLPINTVDLADNLYLVVETKTPTSGADGKPIVQQGSMPVLVNVPSTNPATDSSKEVNNYSYDVNLFMKNYNQLEPEIGKTIDKTTHSIGEEVKYTLTISPLSFDMNEYQELEVTDVLDEALNFEALGVVTFHLGNAKDATITMQPGTDFIVTTPNKGENGTIKWIFTQTGIQKLSGIQAGDGSNLQLRFTALTNEKAKPNQAIPNDSTLDFINKWGYGTKPQPPLPGNPDPKEPTSPKPSEVVNTIFGERYFEKLDKANNTIKLQGAEFIVRNTSVNPVTALNEANQLVTYPANTLLYGIIKDGQIIGWTNNGAAVTADVAASKPGESKYTITSDAKGKFHVEGLAYTNEINYRKQYIFSVMKIANNNGTQVEVVDHYEYVTAAPRTTETTQAAIDAEIAGIIAKHPGTESGDGAWKLYKESEADPKVIGSNPTEMIDYLGKAINDYELIEVRAPEGYAPIEKAPQDVANGTTEKDPYEHPFKFTVPSMDQGLPNYNNNEETEIKVPNAKIPRIPITGGVGTVLFILVGVGLMGGAYILHRKKEEPNSAKRTK